MSVCYAQWEIPSAETGDHPTANDAPASDARTYPFSVGFADRQSDLIQGLASYNIWAYRAGYYAEGNDPAKRVPAHAGARLILDPQDQDALEIMNDDRSPNEHYHFAAVNWARFLPIFRDALTDATFQEFSNNAANYGAYTSPGGTENHKVMSFTSGLVLADYIAGDRIGKMNKDDAKAKLKNTLRSYVKGLYRAGQGEWDSSTYLVFDLNGMLNIYDFATDPECRLMAKAALDWLTAGYALKYTDGVFCSPHKRGYADEPVDTKTDETGWLWWGTESGWQPEDMSYHYVTFQALLSSYRPPGVISRIATGQLPAFEARNSKPNYWFGQGISPVANEFQESVYKTPHYTMGTLWNGYFTDISRFQLVAEGPNGGLIFTGGSPMKWHHWDSKWQVEYRNDGIGKYDQSCQVGAAHITMTVIPPETELHEEHQYAFFDLPTDTSFVEDPKKNGNWFVIQADSAFIGLFPLCKDSSQIEYRKFYQPRMRAYTERRLYFNGERTGFILQTADMESYASINEFACALNEQCQVDTSGYQDDLQLSFTSLAGDVIDMQYHLRNEYAAVAVNGESTDLNDWPLYDSPYITCQNSVLTVNDGETGFEVDFSGDLPVYQPWQDTKVVEYTKTPSNYKLGNYPNPFNSSTMIQFHLRKSQKVHLDVYDIAGRHVCTLLKDNKDSGLHTVIWNGRDEKNHPVASGVYIYRLNTGDSRESGKMLLVQ